MTTTRRKLGTVVPGIAPLDPGTGRNSEDCCCCSVADSCIIDEERHFRTRSQFQYLEGCDPNKDPSSEENECYQKPDDTPNCGTIRSQGYIFGVSSVETNLGMESIRRSGQMQRHPSCSLSVQWYRLLGYQYLLGRKVNLYLPITSQRTYRSDMTPMNRI